METIKKEVHVKAPVETAYGLWTSFERFPEFMENVEEVRKIGERRLHWKANIGGVREEWDADITAMEPNSRVAWRSTSGSNFNSGTVSFRPEDGGSVITVEMEVEPKSKWKEIASKITGLTKMDVKEDLKNFKEILEEGPRSLR